MGYTQCSMATLLLKSACSFLFFLIKSVGNCSFSAKIIIFNCQSQLISVISNLILPLNKISAE